MLHAKRENTQKVESFVKLYRYFVYATLAQKSQDIELGFDRSEFLHTTK